MLIVSVVASVGLVGTVATVGIVNYYAGDLPSLDALQTSSLSQATEIFDRNGTLIDTIYSENRVVVPLAKISPLLQQATVATEDRGFYQHQGVDYRRLAYAAFYDLTHHTAALGGSTITEQVAKNYLLGQEAGQKVFDRKIKELLLAEEMERKLSKDQILELYLNSINYGNGAFGAEQSAETYFGVHASELDLPEASFLAGLPQSPSRYNAFGTAEEQAAAKTRWRDVLNAMSATGAIASEKADQAYATDLWKRMREHHQSTATGRDPRTAHFVDYVRSYLEDKYGHELVLAGGLRVTTSLDLPTQYYADQMVRKGVATYKAKGANTGALLAMNPKDGEVIAMVGSADYNNEDILGQVNLTGVNSLGYRPPGSSFKAYTYGADLETGGVTAATRVDDQTTVINGHTYSDWDGKTEGWIPLRQAFQESRNLPALETYKAEGGSKVVSFMRRLGVTTPIESADSLPTTLGTNPVSMMEHLEAYSAFDNGGFRITPHPILKITDPAGKILESFNGGASTFRVMSPELAYLETDILRGPPRIYLGLGNRAVAAKSGTTESWTGAYWIGFTPDVAVATYMAHINKGDSCDSGFAQYATGFKPSGWMCPTNVLWGEHVGESVWKPFLDGYYSSKPWPAAWTQPAGIVKKTVCKLDGNLADEKTPADQKYDEIFIQGVGEPGPRCGPGAPPGTVPVVTTAATPAPTPTALPSPASSIVKASPSPH